jgi:phosphotransferase system enzyme I (PtsI)
VLLQLSREMQLSVLIPMVTLADEVQRVRSELKLAAAKLSVEPPRLGVMIETPAAALCAREIANHCDFLSIGSNDLTQYTMVAGRENPLVADYFDDQHPAVLRLIRMVCTESRCLPISVCGELAASSSVIDHLLNFHIRMLSVAPPLIPQLKEQIRSVTLKSECVAYG